MVNARVASLCAALVPVLSALGACSADDRPLTQLILVADTDVNNIDSIQFEVSGLGSVDKETAQAAHSATTGPAFVSIVRDDGSLGPLTVVARGLRGNDVAIERTQRVSFVAKQTRVVLLHLFASCLRAPRCAAELACDGSGCIAQELSPAQLLTWTGTPPRLNGTPGPMDGGSSDAGPVDGAVSDAAPGDGGGSDAGNPILRECGAAGSVDIQSNVAHCGSCDRACTAGSHYTSAACLAGTCSYVCADAWAACDTMPANGCETDTLTSNEHCGKCDSRCNGGGKTCTAGTCVKP
jgi:hypothetical protein